MKIECWHGGLVEGDVIWFSKEPLPFFGTPKGFTIEINNPLVVNANGAGWSDKLWYLCCDEDGKPNCNPQNTKRLTDIMPSFIWELAQESDVELEYGDVPYIANGMGYDGVIFHKLGETPNCSIITDVYTIYNINQIKK